MTFWRLLHGKVFKGKLTLKLVMIEAIRVSKASEAGSCSLIAASSGVERSLVSVKVRKLHLVCSEQPQQPPKASKCGIIGFFPDEKLPKKGGNFAPRPTPSLDPDPDLDLTRFYCMSRGIKWRGEIITSLEVTRSRTTGRGTSARSWTPASAPTWREWWLSIVHIAYLTCSFNCCLKKIEK